MSTTLLSALLGVVGMVGWGSYDFLGGLLARRLGSFRPLVWSQVAGAVSIVVVAAFAGTSVADVPTRSLLLAPVAAALYCGGYLFFFKGFEKGDVSIVAATMNVWAVVTMGVAFGFAGQRLTTAQSVGAFMIIAGSVLAAVDWGRVRHQGFEVSAGVPETLLGAVLFGVYWNVSEVISEDAGWLRTTVLVKVGIVAILLALAIRARTTMARRASAGSVLVMLAMGGVEVVAVAAVNYGLAIGDAILVTPIASALSVVTIALAVVVLRDRVCALQGFGMAMAVAGIVTTSL